MCVVTCWKCYCCKKVEKLALDKKCQGSGNRIYVKNMKTWCPDCDKNCGQKPCVPTHWQSCETVYVTSCALEHAKTMNVAWR